MEQVSAKNPPIYIALEGMEGAGKSSVIKELVEQLTREGYNVEFVQEPGSTPMAMDIRAVVKRVYPGEVVDPLTELLLFFAARNQTLRNRVTPALNAGKIVISDRSYMSSMAYQGYGSGMNVECDKLITMVVRDLIPTLTIYLDVDPEIGLARAAKRSDLDRIEQNELAYFQRVRNRFKLEAKHRSDVVEIDANGSFAGVYASVISTVLNHLAEKEYTLW